MWRLMCYSDIASDISHHISIFQKERESYSFTKQDIQLSDLKGNGRRSWNKILQCLNMPKEIGQHYVTKYNVKSLFFTCSEWTISNRNQRKF